MRSKRPKTSCQKCGGKTEPYVRTNIVGFIAADWFAVLVALPALAFDSIAFIILYLLVFVPLTFYIVRLAKQERHFRCMKCGTIISGNPRATNA